tara:strand:- start:135 stop:1127 length:993 start_codon:yes stop_codon:yes gene_type:complete
MPLKLGLIGCSNVAKKNLFQYIEESSYYDLWIIGSRSEKKAFEWSQTYNSKYYGNYDDVLNAGIDVVYISLPISLHEEWCIKAANKGVNIICEKSSTISHESTKNLLAACKKNGVRIMEAFSFRFHPQHQEFKKLSSKNSHQTFNFYGHYGMPSFPKDDIRWNKDLGGGVLNDVACYPICAARNFFECEPISIYSKMTFDTASQVDVKVDIMAEFAEGKVAFLSGGFDHYYQSKYSIWTDEMRLELERAYAVPPSRKTKILVDIDDKISEKTLDAVDQFGLMFDNFYDVTIQSNNIIFDYEEDLKNQSIFMEAVRKSALEKKVVFLSDFE